VDVRIIFSLVTLCSNSSVLWFSKSKVNNAISTCDG
jgi:hypothetical protein